MLCTLCIHYCVINYLSTATSLRKAILNVNLEHEIKCLLKHKWAHYVNKLDSNNMFTITDLFE